jgi:hypothetical protein
MCVDAGSRIANREDIAKKLVCNLQRVLVRISLLMGAVNGWPSASRTLQGMRTELTGGVYSYLLGSRACKIPVLQPLATKLQQTASRPLPGSTPIAIIGAYYLY